MPHIDLPEGIPGIRSAMQFRPETAVHLNALAEELLRADNSLPRGDRELIAAYVSSRNKTVFCEHSHSAFAAVQLDGGIDLVEQVKSDPDNAPIEPKLRALLHIAGKVAVDGKSVTSSDIEAARVGRCDRCRDPRHGAHRGSLLHVQPLRRRSRYLAAHRSAAVPGTGPLARRTRLRRPRACGPLATSAHERKRRGRSRGLFVVSSDGRRTAELLDRDVEASDDPGVASPRE